MPISVLLPGMTKTTSTEFTVDDGTYVLVSVYTDTGTDVPSGPVLTLETEDINGEWIKVATTPFGVITLHRLVQHLEVVSPGKYRVSRPDLTPWAANVGVEIHKYSV